MAILIYRSDFTSLFQEEASIRVRFFKIFITHLDTDLFKYQAIPENLSLIFRQSFYTKSNCFCVHSIDTRKYQNNILRSYNKHKWVHNGAINYLRQNNYKIIRPLLYLSRTDISLICKTLKIPLYPDKSNQSLKYSRNRIRKQLLPTLKLFYNPQIEQALFKFAEFVSKEQYFINILVKAIPNNFLAK